MNNLSKIIATVLCAAPIHSLLAADGLVHPMHASLSASMQQAPRVGRMEPAATMTLTIMLPVKNSAELIDAAEQVSDPASPYYRQFLTSKQFADQYGAAPADYQTLLDWADAHHLAVTPHVNRLAATVTATVADIEAALNIHMIYGERPDGSKFFEPDVEPSLKFALPVDHISGLDDYLRPNPAGGSGPAGAYQGADFRHAYVPQMAARGAGQKVGIFMFDGFAQSDINTYAEITHQTFATVQTVPTNAVMTPGLEGSLDVEMVLSMAPTTQVVAFVGSDGSSILSAMADRTDIKQFSSSWFWYNATNTDANTLAQMSLQGQSFFQASGDGGAYPPTWPATQPSGLLDCRQLPFITIVGGTSLDMSNEGASYGALETAWPDSSGGTIPGVPLPSYQSKIAGHNGASSTLRNAPDVSAQAADARIVFDGEAVQVVGTSQATPLWAGFMALVNETAADGGVSPPGFANPKLYSIAATSAYDSRFHDVISGCTPNGLPGAEAKSYCSGSGYDLTTGLGSPRHALIYSLSGVSAYPLFCQGPLVTSGGRTTFKWASVGAGTKNPGPGECAWANRGPSGNEIKTGNENTIDGDLGAQDSPAAGKFFEVGVFSNGSDLVLTQNVGFLSPPFSSSPSLP